ncbi:replication protein A 70 kDa DNA-binding subunit D-like [Senna tora]|uniref:Replication protein A 70 kDa DNA-binding subunit D-like n=1 Tax=Senna tora TaxID=362788 RepID=A0A834TGE0_9FABA|nr:replication protein A 70 kDa DNA-binding subunit D-like [Senna tora]
MTQMFDAVRHISISHNKWTIKVRVVRIWDTSPYPKTWAYHRMEMGAIVVAIEFCKIKEYSGSTSLSNSMFATRFFINSDVNELIEFRQGLQPQKLASPVNPNLNISGAIMSPLNAAFNGLPLSLIDDLYHSGDRAVVCILVEVLQVNNDRGWFYDACKWCAKKLEPDGAIFFCNKCQGLVNTSTSRFKIELIVMDDSSTANITVFDHEASTFRGMSTIELRKEHLEGKLKNKSIGENSNGDQIDLRSNDDDLITPVNDKSATIVDLEGRKLSFVDDSDSPIIATPSNDKRSTSKVSDDCTSSMDMSMNIDIPMKRIKIEKK